MPLNKVLNKVSVKTAVKHGVINAVAGAALLLTAGQVLAAADCPKAPKEQWMHVLDMQKKIVNEYGFAIKKFETSGDCYEIYGWGLNDAKTEFVKIEVYFNPVTGEIVKKEME